MIKRYNKMRKTKLIFTVILVLTLTLLLSGCRGEDDDLEGKNIVTFEINGGTLNYGTSSTTTNVNFAYHPGTYILAPETLPNYSISRNGYNFTGWYTGAECKPEEKWDFTRTFDTETLILYAGWEKAIKYSYTLYYTDGTDVVSLGRYDVAAGDKFEDWLKYSDKRDGYTGIGFYSDSECQNAWDFDYEHPGGNVDLDIPVYVKYIAGRWQLVNTFDKLKSALASGNVYLTADIDCGGAELPLRDFNILFEGNGYTVSNFTVKKGGTQINPAVAIFKSLGSNAEVRHINFENVTFNFFDIRESTDKVEVKVNVAALAVNITAGAKVTDVYVSGTIATNYNGEFPSLNEVYYHKDSVDAEIMAGVTDFTANIVVNKQ